MQSISTINGYYFSYDSLLSFHVIFAFFNRYGNHFGEIEPQVGCMLLPKLMSINCAHFDFPACVFTERNMYLKDRHTGAGREGSGRVAAFKATGLLYSYTLEGKKYHSYLSNLRCVKNVKIFSSFSKL